VQTHNEGGISVLENYITTILSLLKLQAVMTKEELMKAVSIPEDDFNSIIDQLCDEKLHYVHCLTFHRKFEYMITLEGLQWRKAIAED
jgi:hypothetical protein